ncbi:hypothetical protein AB4254_11280 [Vibrio breoganii]
MFGFRKQLKQEVGRAGGLFSLLSPKRIAEEYKLGRESEPQSAVSLDVDQKEFRKRYRIASVAFYVVLLSIIGLLGSFLFFIEAIAPRLIHIGVLIFFSFKLFTVSYELWRARYVAQYWETRSEILVTTYTEFLVDVKSSLAQFFPLGLEFKTKKRK